MPENNAANPQERAVAKPAIRRLTPIEEVTQRLTSWFPSMPDNDADTIARDALRGKHVVAISIITADAITVATGKGWRQPVPEELRPRIDHIPRRPACPRNCGITGRSLLK